jgi:hypothetical protein
MNNNSLVYPKMVLYILRDILRIISRTPVIVDTISSSIASLLVGLGLGS